MTVEQSREDWNAPRRSVEEAVNSDLPGVHKRRADLPTWPWILRGFQVAFCLANHAL